MSEIYGIIKNAIEHGWPIPEIRDSLVNSGYNLTEIEAELAKFSPAINSPTISSPNIYKNGILAAEEKRTNTLQEYQLPNIPEKKNKGLKIFLIILAILFFGFLSIVIYAFIDSLSRVV